jgi:hypothetical protein
MTNTQVYLAIGLPCLTIMASLVISVVQWFGVRESIREIREGMREIRDDIRGLNAKLDILTGKVAEIDTRLTLIEERFHR